MKKKIDLTKSRLAANQKIKERDYWINKLSGDWLKSTFSTNYPRSPGHQRLRKINFCLPAGCVSRLMKVSGGSDLKLYIILAAGLTALLYKYTGNNDIIIGTPIRKLDSGVDFINSALVLRNHIQAEMTFRELLLEMKQNLVEAVENSSYPVEILPEQLNIPFSLEMDFPLFDVAVLLGNLQDKHYLRNIKLNMIFSFLRTGENVDGEIEYNASVYEETFVKRIIDHLAGLLERTLDNLDMELSRIDILSEAEKNQIIFDFNRTDTFYPADKTVSQLFKEQVEKTPDHIAVAAAVGGVAVTYRELSASSDRLAARLRIAGVLQEEVVGVPATPSIGMIAGLIAILEIGGAYLPVNPAYPDERKEYLYKDANVGLVLSELNGKMEVIGLDSFHREFGTRPVLLIGTSGLAYIIYTSGSTGRPKGVMVEHRNIVRLVKNTDYIDFSEPARIMQTGALEFDASTFEIWGALLNGWTLYTASKDEILNPHNLRVIIHKHQVTTLWMTSPLFNRMSDVDIEIFAPLRHLLVGGDVLSPVNINRVRHRFPGLKVINGYGPTENTTFSTTHFIDREYTENIPIGRPIANSTAYIVDRSGNLVPIGAPGELLVGGDGVSRGYLNNPEFTAERFHWSNMSHRFYRTYRTGDLARWHPDGTIEFLGRMDQQLKIRGVRIEPGEIENRLLTCPRIKEAVVIGRETPGGEKYLCAYFTADGEIDIAGIREYLSARLPDYMIPGYFMQLEAVPLTTNGKIDRKALPAPEFFVKSGVSIPPRDEVEEKLAEIWADILNLSHTSHSPISIDADFFQSGGHSLSASVLISRIRKAFDAAVPLKQIFVSSTIRKLAEYIKGLAAKDRYIAIDPIEKREYYDLSPAQKRLYILQQLEPESIRYNIPFSVVLDGPLNREKLENAFRKLVARHESLRTSFHFINENPVQVVQEEVQSKIADLNGPELFINRPFDLSSAPLLRVGLLKEEETKHILTADMHHIITDGTSTVLLIGEFTALYAGEELSPLPLQYKDYARWQNSETQREAVRQQEEYWLKQFQGDIPVLDLPTDFARPVVQRVEGNSVDFLFSAGETAELNRLALKVGMTLYMVFLSIINVLLSRLSNREDIVVGTPVAARGHADLQKIIGMFVNTLALRNFPAGEKTFVNFLKEIKERTFEALENQDYHFENLVEKVLVNRDTGRNPLFDVTFAWQNMEVRPNDIPFVKMSELEVKPYENRTKTAKFDLTFTAFEEGGGVSFFLEYCTALFKEETVERFVGYFKNIVHSILENPDRKIYEIELISEAEKHWLIKDFNDTDAGFPADRTIHRLFEERAAKSPGRVAVYMSDRFYRSHLTYSELNRQSDLQAFILREEGIGPDIIAAIMMERSIDMIVGILSILKAGGAYLPVDPEYPEDRIRYMLEDSGAKVVVKNSGINLNDRIFVHMPVVLNFENLNFEFVSDFELRALDFLSSDLAYIIYTSGTTGKPKGVLIEHRNVVRLLFNSSFQFTFDETDTWTLFHSFCFDFSVWEMYGALLYGGKAVIIPWMAARDPERLLELLIRQQVTVLNQTPSAFYNLIRQESEREKKSLRLRYVIFGGEALGPGKLVKWIERYPDTKLINMYGITETCVHVTFKEITHGDIGSDICNIGKPIPTTTTYIMDKHRKLHPTGVVGELCVGGEGVGRGYLNRPELTAEKFIRDPFSKGTLYCSGDLGKLMGNGDIEYLGRMDQQIQLRGFRIELGEIESQLLTHPAVRHAVVISGERNDREIYICAYVVTGEPIEMSDLRKFLSKELPDYMIPSYFIPLETLPLTANGKLDRKSLPLPDAPRFVPLESVLSPETETEKMIGEIWKEVLGLDKTGTPGVNVNFFETGGNSLNIIKVNHKINEVFGKKLPVIDMFRYTTIRSLSRFLDEHGKPGSRVERVEEITAKGRRPGSGIAVIGMAGRFPGAENILQFWENLEKGVESISFFSNRELEETGIEPSLLKYPNYIKANGSLENYDYFDAGFFNYSPREAEIMDPQSRLFHECAWTALEYAGYNPNAYPGAIGLYAGAGYNSEWETRVRLSGKADVLGEFAAWQLMNKDFIPLRISYKLNLKGPAVFVQTACSTSLAAIHTACRALLDRECDMALAGGVSVTRFEPSGHLYRDGMILSSDGHCRAFDAKANGTIEGNGAGIVLLKPLEDAVRDGDFIYAVVKGSAINNDGVRKVGFTAPSIEGQIDVIRAAQQSAGVEPVSVTFVEAHGTATPLGDPVEIEALTRVFGTERKGYCAVGSVKTNIGHLDAAAGAAGFIKTVLALYHRRIPPTLHFEYPNPKIDFENSPFYINSRLKEWSRENYPLRAGVSSFGMGGTNVHVVLEEWVGTPSSENDPASEAREHQLIVLSAVTETALDKMTENLAGYLKENPGTRFADVAYTLQVGRETFKHRKAIICKSIPETADVLSSSGSGEVHTFYCREEGIPFVIFMFPGQGSQYVDMARGLYEAEPLFRAEIDRCLTHLAPLMEVNLKEILYPDENRPDRFDGSYSMQIDRTEITQPVIFAVEYALAKLLISWGIRPYSMIGHSIGEYTAACLAGVFSLEDALDIVVLRGRLMQQMPSGSMLSVSLSEEELLPLLDPVSSEDRGGVELAAVNSSSLCTVSGSQDAVEAFARRLDEKQVQFRRLHTSHAFHSHMMDPVLEEFEAKFRQISLHAPRIPYKSNLTGTWITVGQAVDPVYWSKHLRKTVRFGSGLTELLNVEKAVFIEVGPGNALSTFARKHVGKKTGHYTIDLIRHPRVNIPDERFLLTQLGRLWLYNVPILWEEFHRGQKLRRIPLPTYPFEQSEKNRFPAEKGLEARKPEVFSRKFLQKRKTEIADWFYIPQWVRSSLPPQSPTGRNDESSSWLILIDDHGFGDFLVKFLEQKNVAFKVVKKGSGFNKQEDYETLFDEFRTSHSFPRRIIHMWNITGKNGSSVTMETAAEALETGFYSLVRLAQIIGKSGITTGVQIDVVTSDMFDVIGGDGINPQKAVVLGPVNVIPKEYPNIRCRCIDILHNLSPDQLLTELRAEPKYPVTALRGPYRWVPTLEPIRLEKPGPLTALQEKGVYLITGGLGGIGMTLAEYLVKSVRARVILTGRSGFSGPGEQGSRTADKILKIKELEALGGEVSVLSADAADEGQMRDVIRLIMEKYGRIHGVIHAAGVADGGMIQQRSREASETVLTPKIKGTLVLDRLLKEHPPDFFILCSSHSSFTAPFGQVAYCSANAFLDAFAQWKKNAAPASPCITISINWGAWQKVGMAVEAVKLLEKGLSISLKDEMLPSEGVEAFERILGSPFPQVAVSVRELSIDSSGSPITAKEHESTGVVHRRPELSTGYIEPGDKLEQILARIFRDFLGIEKIGIDDNFFELGISSLDLVQVGNKLKETLNRDIPVVSMFTYSTVRTLARFLKPEKEEDTSGSHDVETETEDLLENTIDLLST